jgi:hypothetical protein
MRALSATLLAATFVFACDKGESTTPPDTAATGDTAATDGDGSDAADAGADADAAPEEPVTWKDMDLDARKMHMGTVVYPKMKEAFQAHDAEVFADFKCQTCHGDDMEAVNFEMPQLTPLPVEGTWDAAVAMDEKTAQFMGSVVMPQMGEMLSMEVKDDGSGEMNCFSCHLKDE